MHLCDTLIKVQAVITSSTGVNQEYKTSSMKLYVDFVNTPLA